MPAAATLAGLAPGTTYHYRLVAVRRGAIVAAGADLTFTTARPVTPAPIARFSLASGRRQRLSGRTVSMKVFCSLPCQGSLSGRLKIGGRRGTARLKPVALSLAGGRTKTVRLRLSKKQAAAVRKALRRHKRVTVSVTVRLTSAATVKTLRKTIVIIH